MNRLRRFNAGPGNRRQLFFSIVVLAVAVAAGTAVYPLLPLGDTVAPPRPPHAAPATFVRVVDGDTIIVRLDNGVEERVRYIGIDTPEMSSPAGGPETYGPEATAANAALLGETVWLALDREHRDRFQRLLAYVYTEDVFVNRWLVENGFAETFVLPPNDRHAAEFIAAQTEAVSEQRGVWDAATRLTVPWEQTAAHVGRAATVEGTVLRTHFDDDSGITFLNFSPNIREQFVVIIHRPFRNEFETPPEEFYAGRRVRVRGIIRDFAGQPQIRVQTPAQIEVIH